MGTVEVEEVVAGISGFDLMKVVCWNASGLMKALTENSFKFQN